MNEGLQQTPDELARAYLLQLQNLASSIQAAMDAIATNQLASLQESVAMQEMSCDVLNSALNPFRQGYESSDSPLHSSIESAVELKILSARAAIRALNLQYATLLKRSGRSIALLASLCRSHTGQFQEAHGPRLKRQTWSCEM